MAATPSRPDRVHLIAALVLGGAVLVWATLLLGTLARAGSAPDRSGTLVAVFPRGVEEAEVLTRVARADGAVVRGTWFGNVWHVNRERPGFAGDLQAAGAVLVLPMLPVDLFGMGGGCGA
jgi:hypothetical protein